MRSDAAESNDDREATLIKVGEHILAALLAVSKAARGRLSEAPSGISVSSLANPSNPMVGDSKAEKYLDAIFGKKKSSVTARETDELMPRCVAEAGELSASGSTNSKTASRDA